jgi:signal recognition particle subunit SRP72
VALIKLDRYDDSLQVLEEGGEVLRKKASLEYAYALYKCGKSDEAAEFSAKINAGRGAKHVEAQANYRIEKFHLTASIYEELLNDKASFGSEDNDLRINTWATTAQLLWKRKGNSEGLKRPTREDLEAFETTYNAACASIAMGDIRQGELLLKRAKELCKTSDDLSSEDKVTEMLPISVQELYILIKQGKLEQAEEIVKEITVDNIPDLSTKRIAQNNIILANRTQSNPYVLHKLFHETPSPTQNDKLFDFQKSSFVANSHSLDLLAQKYDGVTRSTTKALAQRPSPSTSFSDNIISVYHAAARAQSQVGPQALKEIITLLEKHPKDLGLALTVVQLYMSMRNLTSAITTMENLLRNLEDSITEHDQDVRFNPGLVSVLVCLYQLEGRKYQIKSELVKAASHWKQRPGQSTPLLRAAATSLVHSTDPSDIRISQTLFDRLHEQDPSDLFATAGYIASHAPTSPIKTKQLAQSLPPIQELVSDVDVTMLETMGIPQTSTSIAAALADTRMRTAASKAVKAKKRIRKSRLPKGYDPNKSPDPERWLRLQERSTYRPKGKKGKQRVAERTQGGIIPEKSDNITTASYGQQTKTSGRGTSSKKKKGKR